MASESLLSTIDPDKELFTSEREMASEPLVSTTDPEEELFASERKTGDEWELFKENVRPLKRGRNVDLLNNALKSHRDSLHGKSLLEQRRRMIDAIDEYDGDDPLHPWLECIKWVQESFPASGECSGLMVIYEQCVRTFWHYERYKNDLRYLKVWLEYAESCSDAEVIYRFLDANEIGQSHASFYMSYAFHMEAKNKMNKADEIFNLGICRKAQPMDKLEDKYRKFLVQLTRRNKAGEEGIMEDQPAARTFGTLLHTGQYRVPLADQQENVKKKARMQRPERNAPLAIYNDNILAARNQSENLRKDPRIWNNLGTQHDRNKENTSIPSKWTSYKVPQKAGSRPVPPTACLEVFVDEECAKLPATTARADRAKPSTLKLRRANSRSLKNDSELLRVNPLRNFPQNSLPR